MRVEIDGVTDAPGVSLVTDPFQLVLNGFFKGIDAVSGDVPVAHSLVEPDGYPGPVPEFQHE